MRPSPLSDMWTYMNLKAHHYMNLKAQQLCDMCFESRVGGRVTQGAGSHILYVGSGLIKFAFEKRVAKSRFASGKKGCEVWI
jgi:hypothetical protein